MPPGTVLFLVFELYPVQPSLHYHGGAMQGLHKDNIPEIQRSHLAASVLQLKAIGIDNIMTFPWLDAPPAETAVRAMEQLYALGAVNEHAR